MTATPPATLRPIIVLVLIPPEPASLFDVDVADEAEDEEEAVSDAALTKSVTVPAAPVSVGVVC